MPVNIVFDEREAPLYRVFETLVSDSQINHQKSVIPIGDIIMQWKPDETAEFKDIIIIERKTIADLLASIKDGRYEEQSHRLIHSSGIQRHNIIYLIEGTPLAKDKQLVYSTITSINVFKGFSVIQTSSMQETAAFISQMSIKMSNDLAKGRALYVSGEIENAPEYCTVVKKVKKDNVTPQNIGHIMLCQIPGLSAATVAPIMSRFPTIAELIDGLKQNPHVLDDLKTEMANGKTRKISTSCIKNVIAYLIPSTDTSDQVIMETPVKPSRKKTAKTPAKTTNANPAPKKKNKKDTIMLDALKASMDGSIQ